MAYRYWRFVATSTTLGNFGLAGLKMMAVPWGADIMSGGTLTASSTLGGSVSDLQDASKSTYHVTNGGGGPHWYQYDFGSAVDVTQVLGWGRTDRTDCNALTWEIRASTDNFSSSNVLMGSGSRSGYRAGMPYWYHVTGATTEAAEDTAYLYWEVRLFSNSFYANAASFEMRSVPGGTNLMSGGTLTVNDATNGAASNLLDGDTSTIWGAQDLAFGDNWLRYQFASPTTVRELLYRTRNFGYSPSNATPLIIQLRASPDGTTWLRRWEIDREQADFAAATNYVYTIDGTVPSAVRRRFAGVIG